MRSRSIAACTAGSAAGCARPTEPIRIAAAAALMTNGWRDRIWISRSLSRQTASEPRPSFVVAIGLAEFCLQDLLLFAYAEHLQRDQGHPDQQPPRPMSEDEDSHAHQPAEEINRVADARIEPRRHEGTRLRLNTERTPKLNAREHKQEERRNKDRHAHYLPGCPQHPPSKPEQEEDKEEDHQKQGADIQFHRSSSSVACEPGSRTSSSVGLTAGRRALIGRRS